MPLSAAQQAVWLAAALVPGALAFNLPPSPTLFNQIAAVGCFGVVLALSAQAPAGGLRLALHRSAALQAAMALAGIAVLASWIGGALPASLALPSVGLLAAVMMLAATGSALPAASAVPVAFFAAWLVAGGFSAFVAVVQVFAPGLPDGDWIARSSAPGRAVGNMRQPNHLATLLLWSAAAVVPLAEMGALGRTRVRRAVALGSMALITLAIALSGSRTGLVGIGVLALWGLVDRRLSPASRGLLLATPLMYAMSWALTSLWASQQGGPAIGVAARIGQSDLSSYRFAIWRDTIELIRAQPWLGVGFGEFNFAWTLTPLPNRPVEFFDHTHNLPLQLAVELGLPLAALVLGLLGLALWQAWRRTCAVNGETGAGYRAAFVMVLLMALHGQLEYPLWYAHFLLPTAFMGGLCLGAGAPPGDAHARPARWPVVAGLVMVLAAVVVLIDYRRVVVIFSPPAHAAPLEERIADGQKSWFFAHHADYAAATTAERPGDVLEAFKRASHHLLDTRLMIAWATALAQSGDVDRGRYIAARLREFRNPGADEFFAPCQGGAPQPPPFQCEPPQRLYTWRDFR